LPALVPQLVPEQYWVALSQQVAPQAVWDDEHGALHAVVPHPVDGHAFVGCTGQAPLEQ
jgi:hypothetical protein